MLFWPKGQSSNSTSRRPSGEKQAQSQNIDIPFTHEGSLWFISSSGDTIKEIEIEVADNEFETQRGLMDRRSMEENRGMLFIFPQEAPRSFWMKNTHISLDIMYVTEDFRVESIQKYTQPRSLRSLPSKGNAMYVVEVVAGFSDKYNINDSTFVTFSRLDGR